MIKIYEYLNNSLTLENTFETLSIYDKFKHFFDKLMIPKKLPSSFRLSFFSDDLPYACVDYCARFAIFGSLLVFDCSLFCSRYFETSCSFRRDRSGGLGSNPAATLFFSSFRLIWLGPMIEMVVYRNPLMVMAIRVRLLFFCCCAAWL